MTPNYTSIAKQKQKKEEIKDKRKCFSKEIKIKFLW